MNGEKMKKIKAAGWEVGDIDLFLSPEEVAIVDIKFALAKALYERCKRMQVSQSMLAKRVKTTQSKLALAESAGESVSLDYMVRSLFATGATRKDIAAMVAR